jgi:membrane protease YdiL (CAAX protease family)
MQDATRSPKPNPPSLGRAFAEVAAVVMASLIALFVIAWAMGPYWSPLGMLAGVAVAVSNIRRSGESLSDYGFRQPASLQNTVATTLAVLAIAFLTFYLFDPLLSRTFGEADLSAFDPLEGNLPLYLTMLLMSWVGAAFGEEVIYRGFVQTRIALAAGDTRFSWWLAIIIQAAVFSSLHIYQGWTGVIQIFAFSIGIGMVYMVSGRSLLPLILGHGIIDTMAMTAFFLGQGDAV